MKMKKIKNSIAVLITSLLVAANPAYADKLDDVTASGKLRCGVISAAKPFGFLDNKTREVIGYDIDFCKAIAQKMGVEIELVSVSVEGRIPELQQGNIDVLAAALGYSSARDEQVDYTLSYYVGVQMVMGHKNSGFNTLASLAGKSIGTAKGSSTEQYLRSKIPTADVKAYQNIPSAFLALVQGKIDAIAMTDVVAEELQKKSPKPLEIVPEPLQFEPWGIGVAEGETRLLETVNEALADIEKTGKAKEIYHTWFGEAKKRNFKIIPIQEYLKATNTKG